MPHKLTLEVAAKICVKHELGKKFPQRLLYDAQALLINAHNRAFEERKISVEQKSKAIHLGSTNFFALIDNLCIANFLKLKGGEINRIRKYEIEKNEVIDLARSIHLTTDEKLKRMRDILLVGTLHDAIKVKNKLLNSALKHKHLSSLKAELNHTHTSQREKEIIQKYLGVFEKPIELNPKIQKPKTHKRRI